MYNSTKPRAQVGLRLILSVAVALHSTLGLAQTAAAPQSKIQSVINSFSQNTIPDIKDPIQRKAFELYINHHFKGEVDILENWQFDEIASMSSKLDPRGKFMFGAVDVEAHTYTYPLTPEMEKLASEMIKGLGTLKSLFLQPMANIGNWKKLKYRGQYFFEEKHVDRMAKQVLPILDKLYGVGLLGLYRSFFSENRFDPEIRVRLNQALIHMIALNEPAVNHNLRSPRGEDVIQGLRNYLSLRTKLQDIYGDEDESCLSNPIVKVNIPYKAEIADRIRDLEQKMLAQGGTPVHENYRVRPLSLIESPFRSCLASSECSTRHYFNRALDPAFYYFTVTDRDNSSRGHVTVALGLALEDTVWRTVAVVDKIQDIKSSRLPVVIEAVRRSVEAQGYLLAFPDPIDEGHNGLSNYSQITSSIKNLPALTQQLKILDAHKTRASKRDFNVGYSLVFDTHQLKAPLPLSDLIKNPFDKNQFIFEVHPPTPQKKISQDLSVNEIKAEVARLKDGTDSDKMIYLELMDTLRQGQWVDVADFKTTLLEWTKDKTQPIRLRNRALRSILMMDAFSLPEVWPYFDEYEIQTLLLSWEELERVRFERDLFHFVVLSALPYFNPRREVLEQLFNARSVALNPAARIAIIDAAKTPEVKQALRQIVELRKKGKSRQYFVDLVMAIITYEAFARAQNDNNEEVAAQLELTAFERMEMALKKISTIDKEEMIRVAENIAPLLNRPSYEKALIKLLDLKIESLEPLIRSERRAKGANFVNGITLALLGSIAAFDTGHLAYDPNSSFLIGTTYFWAIAATSGASHFAKKYFEQRTRGLTLFERSDYRFTTEFRRRVEGGLEKLRSCERLLDR